MRPVPITIRERCAERHAFEQHENDLLLSREDISVEEIALQDAHNAPRCESKNPFRPRRNKASFFDMPDLGCIGSFGAAFPRVGMSTARQGGSAAISPIWATSLVSESLSISAGAPPVIPSLSMFSFFPSFLFSCLRAFRVLFRLRLLSFPIVYRYRAS